jgi:NAD(P)-dependent dehydrogenase (short-subunit alcohol dehydrogenase family)
LILGGSSGFGLAAARKLAAHGMNLAIVHRDRRAALPSIHAEFERIRATGVSLCSFNSDATDAEQRRAVVRGLEDAMRPNGRLRLLMHSIAFGNLKPLFASGESASAPATEHADMTLLDRLAAQIDVSPERLSHAVDRLFQEGSDALHVLAQCSPGPGDAALTEDDFAHTVHAMGTSLVGWVQEIMQHRLFADDARVVGMTSEGNTVAWEGYAAVSAAKAALESASRSLAVELARHGLRSNIVQAGITDTPALRRIPGHQRLKASARLRNPFRRLTTPEDVANVVYLLSLDEAAWINGALIRVDGGEHVAGI